MGKRPNGPRLPIGVGGGQEDGSDWRMADVIWVDGGARNPKVPTLFQAADVDTGTINWVHADLVTHICPRCPEVATAGLFSETVNSVRVLSDMSGL